MAYVFAEASQELAECIQQLNKVAETICRISENEQTCNEQLSEDDAAKLAYTVSMLKGIEAELDTVIEDVDRLALRDEDGKIFN